MPCARTNARRVPPNRAPWRRRQDIQGLRQEIQGLRQETREEFHEVRQEMRDMRRDVVADRLPYRRTPGVSMGHVEGLLKGVGEKSSSGATVSD